MDCSHQPVLIVEDDPAVTDSFEVMLRTDPGEREMHILGGDDAWRTWEPISVE